MNKFDFNGRIAIVTGAGRGLGLAITERLLDGGAAVSLWDVDRGTLETEAKRLGAKGKVHTAVVDVVNELLVEAAAKAALAQLGRIVNLASMVAWMCSEECSFTTGGVFDISGGRATY